MVRPDIKAGTVEQALANGRRLLDSDPDAALLQARTLLRLDERNPRALRLLAAAFDRLGKPRERELAQIEAIRASQHDRTLTAAAQALREGRIDVVERALAHCAEPGEDEDPVALLILGDARGSIGRFREGEALLRRAVAAAPFYPDAKVALARLLLTQQRPNEALALLDEVLETHPGDFTLLRFRATLLGEIGDHEGAAALYRRLAEDRPGEPALWISLGDSLRTLGRSQQSNTAYRHAVEADPAFGRSWWSVANLRAEPLSDADVETMETSLAARPGDADNLCHLHFALGVAHEQRADHARSFSHYAEGNRLRRGMMHYDPAVVTAEVDRAEQILTRDFFAERAGWGDPSPDPIFILGMPRSGSTLVEQILASHAEIEATAELPIIPVLIQTMIADHGMKHGDSWRELLPRIPRTELEALGAEYLRRAAPHRRTDRPFFLDKLPHNWADLGFIQLVLPNARFIDVRRAPMDCCFSNFKLLFATGHPASCSLEEMGAYYRDYVRQMRHWGAALPGRIHRVIYEHLVEDLEGETRRLLDHLGLAFDPACLAFHKTERAVATASSQQVRQPLNRSGIDAWKPFEPWLDPLKRALGDMVETYAS